MSWIFSHRGRRRTPPRPVRPRLSIEPLEDRRLLSASVIDLGSFGGSTSIAYGLNSVAQVVGNATIANGLKHAFVWDASKNPPLGDLGTLGGLESNANAIANNGLIVGFAQNVDPTKTHATLWKNGTPIDLGTLGGAKSNAFDLTEDGRVVGQAHIPGTPLVTHAFLWHDDNGNGVSDPGEMKDLGTLPGGTFSTAQGINSAGQIAGYAAPSGNTPEHAFLYENGQMKDLGTLGGSDSKAYAINEKGYIAGSSLLADGVTRHAFLYVRKSFKDLGTLGGLTAEAFGLNDLTQVVGTSLTSAGVAHAFLWTNGTMFDLNTLFPGTGWVFTEAHGINAAGQIVGVGVSPNLETHAFLLTPNGSKAADGRQSSLLVSANLAPRTVGVGAATPPSVPIVQIPPRSELPTTARGLAAFDGPVRVARTAPRAGTSDPLAWFNFQGLDESAWQQAG
jgi:probable HAF family extracellular repeat protein